MSRLLLPLSLNGSLCHNIYTIPSEQQCQYALDYCQEDLGLIDYVSLYYCSSSNLQANSLIFSTLIVLITLFTTLGLTASDFLCPNLNTISKFIHAGENVAGLTLLAFGNGSPDLISTYKSMEIEATSLAIGELVGAALFITSIVIGSMCIVHPFKVNKKTFIRDVSYFLICLLIFDYIILIQGNINMISCIILIGLYFIYVIMILIWQYISTKISLKKQNEIKQRNQYQDNTNNETFNDFDEDANIINNDEEENPPSVDDLITNNSLSLSYNPFLSDIEDEISTDSRSWNTNNSRILHSNNSGIHTYDEFNSTLELSGNDGLNYVIHQDGVNDNDDENEEVPTNQYFVRPSILDAIRLNQTISIQKNKPIDLESNNNNDRISLYTVNELRRPYSEPLKKTLSSINFQSNSAPPYFDEPGEEENEQSQFNPSASIEYQSTNTPIIVTKKDSTNLTIFKIFVPSLIGFSQKSIFDKILTILILPLLIILRLTVPVVDYHKFKIISKQLKELNGLKFENDLLNNNNQNDKIEQVLYSKYSIDDYKNESILLTIEIFLTNFIIFFKIFPVSLLVLPAMLINLLICRIVFKIFTPIYQNNLNRLLKITKLKLFCYFVFSILGFLTSLNWISKIVKELINILKFYSIIFKLSNEILGLTIFAIGNSFGDLIANFTIAKMGFPKMALAACFGGPLLNILLGIGLSGVILNKDFKIEKNLTFWVSNLSLILNLLTFLIFIPKNKYKMNEKIGYLVLNFWIWATILNILIEFAKR